MRKRSDKRRGEKKDYDCFFSKNARITVRASFGGHLILLGGALAKTTGRLYGRRTAILLIYYSSSTPNSDAWIGRGLAITGNRTGIKKGALRQRISKLAH
jgi:hypothetical protein